MTFIPNQNYDKLLDDAALGLAGKVAKRAKEIVPVRTGRLRDSIVASKSGKGEAEVTASAPYSIFVEMGTSRAPAQPFLRPALLSATGG